MSLLVERGRPPTLAAVRRPRTARQGYLGHPLPLGVRRRPRGCRPWLPVAIRGGGGPRQIVATNAIIIVPTEKPASAASGSSTTTCSEQGRFGDRRRDAAQACAPAEARSAMRPDERAVRPDANAQRRPDPQPARDKCCLFLHLLFKLGPVWTFVLVTMTPTPTVDRCPWTFEAYIGWAGMGRL